MDGRSRRQNSPRDRRGGARGAQNAEGPAPTQEVVADVETFEALCGRLANEPWIAFDTEFVSEHTYRPHLCLVQVATESELAAIDTLAIDDVTPFWAILADTGREVITHAGREELLFCVEAVGKRPANLFDVQVAAGFAGYEYPAGYGTLVSRLLGVTAEKGETRTDWRRRPLTAQQISYALSDVRYLKPMRDALGRKLEKLNRIGWLESEMQIWQDDIEATRGEERWRRVSGGSNLSIRSLAIVRELWRWREEEARRRDCPSRKVLRDDLIVELARRRSADPKSIHAIRGMERGDLRRAEQDISRRIETALTLPESECPRVARREPSSQSTMLGQFLQSALGSLCREREIAASLVGTANDVRELVAHRLGELDESTSPPPALMQGWRAEVVGQLLDDLLAGKVSIRITDPASPQPLSFERSRESGRN